MADHYSRETKDKLGVGKRHQIDPHAYGLGVKRMRATIDYDGQAVAETISLGELPVGAVVLGLVLTASATLGATATLAIGTEDDPDYILAADTFEVADTPTMAGKASAAAADPFDGQTEILATVGGAALPNSANYLVVDILYSSSAS
jgi:hypothetical protein